MTECTPVWLEFVILPLVSVVCFCVAYYQKQKEVDECQKEIDYLRNYPHD